MFKIQTWYRDMFWEWCQTHKIVCEYMGTEAVNRSINADPAYDTWYYDTWYIGNEKDRTLAILRWS